MTNQPLISIIVPVYNAETFFHKCLDSILAQTYENWEAILVDDGSKDNSGKICDEYAEHDPRFIVVHKQNEGVAKARITAFEHSKGEMITFIDSDDYVTPDYLEILAKPILEQDADIVSCNYYIVESNNISEPRAQLSGIYEGKKIKELISKYFFYNVRIKGHGLNSVLWTKMIKREYVLDGLQQGVGLWYGEDQIGVFSILYKIKKTYLLPDRLYYYMKHDGQAIRKYNKSIWINMIDLYERYKKIDVQCLASNGIFLATWLQIKNTIGKMMHNASVDRKTFVEDVSYMRKTSFMNDFFRIKKLPMGLKDNFMFWLLKYRCFSVYYLLMKSIKQMRCHF